MTAEETYSIYVDCPLKGTMDDWDDDDRDMIALLCEGCPYYDECSGVEYNMTEESTTDILEKYAKLKGEYNALKVQYENAKCEIYLLRRLPRFEPILDDEE